MNTVIINNQCMADSIFGCLGRATVRVQNPPPSITSFGIGMDSMVNFVDGDIIVNGMPIDLYISGTGVVPSCGLRLTAVTTNIDGDYALTADTVDPSNVDVNETGNPVNVGFTNFQPDLHRGICDCPLIGDLDPAHHRQRRAARDQRAARTS